MSLFLEQKYIMYVGDKLDGFKKASNSSWNFRCPFCGDSKTNRNKKRGYLIYYHESGKHAFHCHNCGLHMSFESFLFKISPDLYRDMKRENMRSNQAPETVEAPVKVEAYDTGSKYLKRLSDMNSLHPGVVYMMNRKVPKKSLDRVYWTEDYSALISETFGDKYKDRNLPKEGIVYPLYIGNILSGYQYRTVNPEAPKAHRFVTCTQDGERGFFNNNNIDTSKTIFVVEGCTDALFLPNCIAVTSSTLWSANIPDAVYVNDCEPRNKEVCKQIQKCITRGYKTCLLPQEYYGMDINDMVKTHGFSESELVDLILRYTYSGLTAKVRFSSWKM